MATTVQTNCTLNDIATMLSERGYGPRLRVADANLAMGVAVGFVAS